MKNSSKVIIIRSRVFFLAMFVAFAGSTEVAAQTSRGKAAAPTFTGSIAAKGKEFKAFIIKNIGKRVSLKLTFGEDIPYGYKDQNADPFFSVDNFSYFFDCGEEMTAEWTTRCEKLNWNETAKSITGFFKVTEPKPKVMRTNRSFDLLPTK